MRGLLSLLLLGLTACQSSVGVPPQNFRAFQPNRAPLLQSFKAPHYYGDLAVKFNNAYNELYADNEKAGRRDPQNPDKLFVQLIQKAQKNLDLAIFDLEEPSAVEALQHVFCNLLK